MKSFGGLDSRPRVNLGGRGAKTASREELLRRAADSRRLREEERRRQLASASIAQAWRRRGVRQGALDELRHSVDVALSKGVCNEVVVRGVCYLGERRADVERLNRLLGKLQAGDARILRKIWRVTQKSIGDLCYEDAIRILIHAPDPEPNLYYEVCESLLRNVFEEGLKPALTQLVYRDIRADYGFVKLLAVRRLRDLQRLRQVDIVDAVLAMLEPHDLTLPVLCETLANFEAVTDCQHPHWLEVVSLLVLDIYQDLAIDEVASGLASLGTQFQSVFDRVSRAELTDLSPNYSFWAVTMMQCWPRSRDGILMHLALHPWLALDLATRLAPNTFDGILCCEAYSRMLVTMTDDEFFDQARTPFSTPMLRWFVPGLKSWMFDLYQHADPQEPYEVKHREHGIRSFAITYGYVQGVVSRLLQQLYARDNRRRFTPDGFWLLERFDARTFVDHVIDELQLNSHRSDLEAERAETMHKAGYYQFVSSRVQILTHCPYMVPFEQRVKILRGLIERDAAESGYYSHVSQLTRHRATVRREHEFEDGYSALWNIGSAIKGPLSIEYLDAFGMSEAGIDGGGLTKEFLSQICRQAFNPDTGLFLETADRLLYPNPSSYTRAPEQLRHYEFLGRVVAKCIYEGILIDVAFAPFFLLRWVGKLGSLDDLAAMDRDLYNGLLKLKHYSGDVEADFALDFTLQEEEIGGPQRTIYLLPNGADVAVTNANRLHYIHLVCNYKLNARLAKQSDAFIRGLAVVVDPRRLAMFGASEMQAVVGGAAVAIDVDDLERNTEYAGFPSGKDDSAVKLFWQVMRDDFTDQDRRDLVRFVTSTPRPPLLGFAGLQPKFALRRAGDDTARLPTASTCVNLLKLPPYPTKELMRDKLRYAITAEAGFDLS